MRSVRSTDTTNCAANCEEEEGDTLTLSSQIIIEKTSSKCTFGKYWFGTLPKWDDIIFLSPIPARDCGGMGRRGKDVSA